MLNKVDKLVEATMLALQGKLELRENRLKSEARHLTAGQKKLIRQYVKDGKKKNWSELIRDLEEINDYETLNQDVKRFIDDIDLEESKKTKKSEGIDVNVDDKTTVSVEGNETIVDTEDATVIVNKKEDTFVPETSDDLSMENPIVDAETEPNTDMVEVPANDTVMPEDVLDEPVDTELPTEDEELPLGESKKVENVEIEISDDGKEVEVKTDDGENVEVKDETEEKEDKEDTDEEPKESEDTDVLEVPEEDKQKDETMFEENKKVIEGARDIADQINRDEWFNNDKRKQTLRGMLADKIADVAEGLGDDYSEWVSDMDFDDIINDIINSQEWVAFDEKLNEIITEAVEDKVDWTRRDDPASKYYDGDGLDEGKQADQNKKDIKRDKKINRVQEMIARRRAKKQEEKEIPYDNTTEKICPRCNKKYTKFPALSRRDNKTYICPDCGTEEAMLDFFNSHKKEEMARLKTKGLSNKKIMETKGLKEYTDGNLQPRCDSRASFYKKSKARKAVSVKEAKEIEDKNDLGINEGVPKKEEPVPNTETKIQEKYNKQTFESVLTSYFKRKYRAVESVKVDKIFNNHKGMKIEARLLDANSKEKPVCLEMRKIQSGKSFDKYELIKSSGIITESRAVIKTIMTTTNRNKYTECRYIINKKKGD